MSILHVNVKGKEKKVNFFVGNSSVHDRGIIGVILTNTPIIMERVTMTNIVKLV